MLVYMSGTLPRVPNFSLWFEVNLWDFQDESGSPSQFDSRKVGSPWSCDTKKYGINCQDSMMFSYEQEERERENSFLKCSDWLKLIQSFFWNVLSLEPWKFLGTFRQVNIKRGEEGVEAFRIKGEWQHLSAFAQKSILLQYIKWLQIYEINI